MSKAYSEAQGSVVANLVHASGNVDEAKYEVDVWFGPEDLFEYQTVAERFLPPRCEVTDTSWVTVAAGGR